MSHPIIKAMKDLQIDGLIVSQGFDAYSTPNDPQTERAFIFHLIRNGRHVESLIPESLIASAKFPDQYVDLELQALARKLDT